MNGIFIIPIILIGTNVKFKHYIITSSKRIPLKHTNNYSGLHNSINVYRNLSVSEAFIQYELDKELLQSIICITIDNNHMCTIYGEDREHIITQSIVT